MAKVGDLSSLHVKYFDLGLRVVAISSEPTERLESKLIKDAGAKYWVGSDPEDESSNRYSKAGAPYIPRIYVVGTDGTVLGNEIPKEAALLALLEAPLLATPPRHAKLARASAAFEVANYGYAYRSAQSLGKDADAAVVADATSLRQQIVALADFRRRQFAGPQSGSANDRYGQLQRFGCEFEGVEGTKWVQPELTALERDEQVKRFLAEWARLRNVVRTEMNAEGKPDRLAAVRKQYEELAKQLPRSQVGQLATEYAARLPGGTASAPKPPGK
jgi:hypothetical protein